MRISGLAVLVVVVVVAAFWRADAQLPSYPQQRMTLIENEAFEGERVFVVTVHSVTPNVGGLLQLRLTGVCDDPKSGASPVRGYFISANGRISSFNAPEAKVGLGVRPEAGKSYRVGIHLEGRQRIGKFEVQVYDASATFEPAQTGECPEGHRGASPDFEFCPFDGKPLRWK